MDRHVAIPLAGLAAPSYVPPLFSSFLLQVGHPCGRPAARTVRPSAPKDYQLIGGEGRSARFVKSIESFVPGYAWACIKFWSERQSAAMDSTQLQHSTAQGDCNSAHGGAKNAEWECDISADEEDLIIRLHGLLGDRWALIAGRLPWRKAEEIEKYWRIRTQTRQTQSRDALGL